MNQMKYIYTFAFLISISCFSQTRNQFVVKFKSHITPHDIELTIREQSQINNWRFLTTNKNHPLSNIVKFYSDDFHANLWINQDDIEYIESLPQTYFLTDTLPSDPYLPFQWENAFIKTKSAWQQLEKNDTNFLVGVVDSGSDFEHEDLLNFYINPDEIMNGFDDDDNGFIDDFHGWDFGDYDNDPSVSKNSPHGREITSLVAAETDNGVGLSSLSYNVKYITAKITSDNGDIVDPYEGVLYVIDQGAQVVNCSWYQNISTNYGRDIIDYAISKNVIVVAAAGNSNSDTPIFPASYSDVLGVGAIDETGNKTSVSNYGNWVDIYAPGKNVYVAYPDNAYFPNGGTSISCAITASACCLLKKLFPNETAQQMITRVKRTGTALPNTTLTGGKYLNLEKASQINVITDFIVFPNPSSDGDIFIDLPFINGDASVVLNVFNTLGQLVFEQLFELTNGEKTISTHLNLGSGQYFISVESENIQKTTKLTLAR